MKEQALQDGHVSTRYYAFPSVKNGDLFALKNSGGTSLHPRMQKGFFQNIFMSFSDTCYGLWSLLSFPTDRYEFKFKCKPRFSSKKTEDCICRCKAGESLKNDKI